MTSCLEYEVTLTQECVTDDAARQSSSPQLTWKWKTMPIRDCRETH